MSRIRGDLKERTLKFSTKIMQTLTQLPHDQRGWIIGKQLGRSASSIGANIWEADAALTDADFANKMSIGRKEANETLYWLELSNRLEILPSNAYSELTDEATEIAKILGTIVRKTQLHIKNK